MTLTGANSRQSAAGVVNSATSATVGFPDTCLAGNTVLLLVAVKGTTSAPSGFSTDRTNDFSSGGGPALYWFRLPVASGGETTWTLTTGSAVPWMWRALEFSGLAVPPVSPVSQWSQDGGDGTTFYNVPLDLQSSLSGESGSATRLDVFKFGLAVYFGPASAALVAGNPWRITNGNTLNTWREQSDFASANGSGTNCAGTFWEAYSGNQISGVGDNIVVSLTSYASFGATTSDFYLAEWVSYASVTSAVLDPIVMGTGFEFGTHDGITGGPAAAPGPAQIADAVAGTHGTGYQVTTAAPKNGTYHLRVTAAATAPFVRWTTSTLGTGLGQAVFGGYVKCVSATSNPAVLAEFAPAAGTTCQIVYNPSTTKIGVRWGAGTPSYQAQTTALGSYAWVDLLATFNSTTWAVSWRCEEAGAMVGQTKPTDLTGQTASTWASATLGSATSQTMTADYDDVCLSNALTDYPLGRHKVVLLIPNTAVAAGLAGSAGANMAAITANATGSTLTTVGAANIPVLLDEVPPNFSASADGVCSVNVGTTDYVELAMTSYTAASTERIDAVRLYVAGWAVSSTTAAFGLRGYNGLTETVLVTGATSHGAFNSTTTGSATNPGWYCKQYGDVAGWTQTKLDALRVRIGYSADATPDIGAHAVYAEVAVSTDFTSGLPSPEPVFRRTVSPSNAPPAPGVRLFNDW